jgi:hypothetical protein
LLLVGVIFIGWARLRPIVVEEKKPRSDVRDPRG